MGVSKTVRILIRQNIDLMGAVPLFDTTFSSNSPSYVRANYEAIKNILHGMIETEMEAIFNNPAHNYLDVLIVRRTV